MTPEETQLFQSLLSEVQGLKKEITTINKALSFKTTAVKKKESLDDIARFIVAQSLTKGKGSRKAN